MQQSEEIVLIGKYWKRKGWSHRRCLLLLTTLGKLMYFDAKPPYTFRGTILWTLTRPLRPIKVMDERFDIELADSSRTYHFYDEQGHGCDKWLEVISQINASRRSYLRLNMGEYDADVLEAMARRKKKRKETACYIL